MLFPTVRPVLGICIHGNSDLPRVGTTLPTPSRYAPANIIGLQIKRSKFQLNRFKGYGITGLKMIFSIDFSYRLYNKLCGRPPQYALPPVTMTFDLFTLKVVSQSRVTWATSVPILVFLGHSVRDLGPMYATIRQTSDVRQTSDSIIA